MYVKNNRCTLHGYILYKNIHTYRLKTLYSWAYWEIRAIKSCLNFGLDGGMIVGPLLQ